MEKTRVEDSTPSGGNGQKEVLLPNSAAKKPIPTAKAKANSAKAPLKKAVKTPTKAVSSSGTDITNMQNEIGKLAQTMDIQHKQQTAFQNMIIQLLTPPVGDMDDNSSVTSDGMPGDTLADKSGMYRFIDLHDHAISDSEYNDEDEPSGSTVGTAVESKKGDVNDIDKSNTTASGSQVDTEGMDIGFAQRFAIPLEEGEPIRQKTANAVSCLMVSDMAEEAKTKAYDRYQKPKNCPTLRVPKDVKIQNAMKPMVKGLIAMAKTPKPSQEQEEGLALIAHAYFEMNNLRKELIKPELNKRYVHLCKPTVKPTEWLFGDQLSKTVKDLDEEQKAAGVMRGYAYGGRTFTSNYAGHPFRKKFYNHHNSAPYHVAGWQSGKRWQIGCKHICQPFFREECLSAATESSSNDSMPIPVSTETQVPEPSQVPTESGDTVTAQETVKTADKAKQIVRQSYSSTGISERTIPILLTSWRKSTQKQYNVYIQKWLDFCHRQQTNPVQTTITRVLTFLTELHLDNKLGYAALNTARSALSAFVILPGGAPLTSRSAPSYL
ncbi:uncharacterized protein [Amphiura filiformis]|uniref:uncharacterized protein n=1 Tax=Amphiura filiformis TaxID=82378 RepID=UPI003B20EDE8